MVGAFTDQASSARVAARTLAGLDRDQVIDRQLLPRGGILPLRLQVLQDHALRNAYGKGGQNVRFASIERQFDRIDPKL